MIVFRAGELLLELRDSVLIDFDGGVGPIGLRVQFFALGRWRSRMLGGLTHLVTEGDIYGVVSQFERLPRISLLFPVGGEGRHGAGSGQRLFIDDRRPACP